MLQRLESNGNISSYQSKVDYAEITKDQEENYSETTILIL